jgi:hypothetical protein
MTLVPSSSRWIVALLGLALGASLSPGCTPSAKDDDTAAQGNTDDTAAEGDDDDDDDDTGAR